MPMSLLERNAIKQYIDENQPRLKIKYHDGWNNFCLTVEE